MRSMLSPHEWRCYCLALVLDSTKRPHFAQRVLHCFVWPFRENVSQSSRNRLCCSYGLFRAIAMSSFGLTFLLRHKPLVDFLSASMRFLEYPVVRYTLCIGSIVLSIFDLVLKYPPECLVDPSITPSNRLISTTHHTQSY